MRLNSEGRKAKFVVTSLEKCVRQISPIGPSETNAGGGCPGSHGEQRKLRNACLVSYLWYRFQRRWARLRLPAVLSSAVSSAARRRPLVYKALLETWLAAPLTGKSARLQPPREGRGSTRSYDPTGRGLTNCLSVCLKRVFNINTYKNLNKSLILLTLIYATHFNPYAHEHFHLAVLINLFNQFVWMN